MRALIWEYYLTPTRFEVRLFRLIPVYWLQYANVVEAHAMTGLFNFPAMLRLGYHPWNGVALANRWKRKWVLLEKRR